MIAVAGNFPTLLFTLIGFLDESSIFVSLEEGD